MTTLNEYVSNFCKFFADGVKNIEQAAVQYASAMRDYPREAPVKFRASLPQMSNSGWDKMLMIGNKGANPNIMWLTDVAAARVVRLPRKEQDKLLDNNPKRTIVVVDRTTGVAHTRKINNLTKSELDVAFNSDTGLMRSRKEQEKYVKDERKRNPRSVGPLYRIEGNTLKVLRAGTITKEELISIVKEMAK